MAEGNSVVYKDENVKIEDIGKREVGRCRLGLLLVLWMFI